MLRLFCLGPTASAPLIGDQLPEPVVEPEVVPPGVVVVPVLPAGAAGSVVVPDGEAGGVTGAGAGAVVAGGVVAVLPAGAAASSLPQATSVIEASREATSRDFFMSVFLEVREDVAGCTRVPKRSGHDRVGPFSLRGRHEKSYPVDPPANPYTKWKSVRVRQVL